MSKKNFRKTAAIGLAFIGLAGVGVASAATLSLNGEDDADLVQAGVTDLSADLCQTGDINVTFTNSEGAPGDLVVGGPFGYPAGVDSIELSGIADGCVGKTIQVALGNVSNAIVGEEYGPEEILGTSLTLDLNGGGEDFGGVLTDALINSITQISVTIY